MKKLALLLAFCLLPLGLLAGCGEEESPSTSSTVSTPTTESVSSEESIVKTPDPNAATVWNDLYADEGAGLTGPESIYSLSVYENGNKADTNSVPKANNDVRYVFAGDWIQRLMLRLLRLPKRVLSLSTTS